MSGIEGVYEQLDEIHDGLDEAKGDMSAGFGHLYGCKNAQTGYEECMTEVEKLASDVETDFLRLRTHLGFLVAGVQNSMLGCQEARGRAESAHRAFGEAIAATSETKERAGQVLGEHDPITSKIRAFETTITETDEATQQSNGRTEATHHALAEQHPVLKGIFEQIKALNAVFAAACEGLPSAGKDSNYDTSPSEQVETIIAKGTNVHAAYSTAAASVVDRMRKVGG